MRIAFSTKIKTFGSLRYIMVDLHWIAINAFLKYNTQKHPLLC